MTRQCTHWDAAAARHCGGTPTRLYIDGWRCATCTPAAIAKQPEPGQHAHCAPLRHYCPPEQRCPRWEPEETP